MEISNTFASEASSDHQVPVRKIRHDFTDVPRDWQSRSVIASAISVGVNLLFPHGERFFVRSVRRFEKHITDPVLRKQIRGFYGQEGSHAREHERYFEILRARGHDIDGFLAKHDAVIRAIEARSPAIWSLAATAAAEHYTAIMSDFALSDGTFDEAHPIMRDLLSWHAAEEIEHKAVAFDVLQAVDPRWHIRAIGMFVATVFLVTNWAIGTALLLKQSGLSWKELRADRKKLRAFHARRSHTLMGDVFIKGILTYLKRDFHPWQEQNLDAAKAYIARRPDLQTRVA